jgi:hypothetical protein
MDDRIVRAALERHWPAFDASDFETGKKSTARMPCSLSAVAANASAAGADRSGEGFVAPEGRRGVRHVAPAEV